MADITTVTFDLWQTLLLDNRELGMARAMVRLEGAQKALAQFGEEYELEHIREAYRACYRQCRAVREQQFDVSFQEQVEIFVENISPGLVGRLQKHPPGASLEEIVRVYADSFMVCPPAPHVDALSVLRDLRAMGFSLGLISNTGMTPGATFRTYLDQEGMLGYFDKLTFSDEVRLAKPSNEMFLMTLRAMGVKPVQAIHVGDHVVNDVVGAKRSGMKAIWITGFYERADPADPESEPDATVSELGMVVGAVAQLSGRRVPG